MCGISGWVDLDRDLRGERETAEAMTATMELRGPDDAGLWLAEHAAVGHRRLAVIDPPGGVQPMADGDVVLTYSGEVYNFRELRSELASAGHEFRTSSDTEVVLRAYQEWGEEMLHRLNGMYAFAIWDGEREELLLARDRMGVKPLYYYPLPNGILFGSEPKAILANPRGGALDQSDRLLRVLDPGPGRRRRDAVPEIFELRPGHYLRLSRDGLETHRYWGLEARPHEDDLPTTVATVRDLLEDIMTRQLVCDVPLCMLLSGGIDSSVITALGRRARTATGCARSPSTSAARRRTSSPIRCAPPPTLPSSQEVVRHVGCAHEDIVLETEDLCGSRNAALGAAGLGSARPTSADMDISLYLLFRAIREHSTVALSGESADEVFGGYPWLHDSAALSVPIFPWLAYQMQQGTPAPFSLFNPESDRAGSTARPVHARRIRGRRSTKSRGSRARADTSRACAKSRYLDLTRFVRDSCSIARTAPAWPSGSRSGCRSATTAWSSTSSTLRGR